MNKKNELSYTLIRVVIGLLIGAAIGNVSLGFVFGMLIGNATDNQNQNGKG